MKFNELKGVPLYFWIESFKLELKISHNSLFAVKQAARVLALGALVQSSGSCLVPLSSITPFV